MSEAWSDTQEMKYGHNALRARVMDRRKVANHQAVQRAGSDSASLNGCTALPFLPTNEQRGIAEISKSVARTTDDNAAPPARHHHMDETLEMAPAVEVEKNLLMVLCDASLDIPSHSKVIADHTSRLMEREIDLLLIEDLLRKYVSQKLLSIRFNEGIGGLFVSSLDFSKLSVYLQDLSRKWSYDREDEGKNKQHSKTVSGTHSGDLEQQYLVDNIKPQEGSVHHGFCQYGSRDECHRMGPEGASCKLQHFKKTTQKNNSGSVGDCSLLTTCFNMDSGKESSNMAANTGDTTQQHMNTCSLLQAHVPGWYCDYEANGSLAAVYPGHRQEPVNRSYSSEPYEPTSIMDASHISGQSFPVHPTSRRIDPSRPYLDSSTGNILLVDLPRSSGMNPERNMPVRTFPSSRNPNGTPGGIPGSHTPGGSGNILNNLARPYIPLTEAEVHIPQSSLLSEMPGTSSFPYPAIPYTLTLPPPAPAASAVASTPFTEVNDVPSFDMTGPIMSYPWSVTGDLYQTNMSSVETKTSSKVVKSKSGGGGGKRRCRRPELWKKNVTKSKKLKGEEHVSRTGSVIPAKQVFEVDCSNCSFKCHENFSEDLRRQLFEVFYSLASNESQKQFVCQNVQESATKVGNTNKKEGSAENKRKVCRKYFLPDTDNTRKQVCSKFFCRTLAIGKTFITHALRNKQFGCYVGKEKRGKPHNKIPDVQLEPARQHIISLLTDSSTGSKRASKKKCVEQGLNITKMYEMYKQDCAAKSVSAISLSMYRRIFHTEF